MKMQPLTTTTHWETFWKHEGYDQPWPMVYLFQDEMSREFLVFLYWGGVDHKCTMYTGHIDGMYRHDDKSIKGSYDGSTMTFMINDSYSVEIGETDELIVCGWTEFPDVEWKRVRPQGYRFMITPEHNRLQITKKS